MERSITSTYRLRAYRDDCTLNQGDLSAKDAKALRDKLINEGWTVYARCEYVILPEELDKAATKEGE